MIFSEDCRSSKAGEVLNTSLVVLRGGFSREEPTAHLSLPSLTPSLKMPYVMRTQYSENSSRRRESEILSLFQF